MSTVPYTKCHSGHVPYTKCHSGCISVTKCHSGRIPVTKCHRGRNLCRRGRSFLLLSTRNTRESGMLKKYDRCTKKWKQINEHSPLPPIQTNKRKCYNNNKTTHTDVHKHARTHSGPHAYTFIHKRTHALRHTTHAHKHTCTRTDRQTHARAQTNTRTCTDIRV